MSIQASVVKIAVQDTCSVNWSVSQDRLDEDDGGGQQIGPPTNPVRFSERLI
jgi:hypothetical protein